MSFKAGRLFAAALVLSALIQMQIAEYGYAARRTKIAFSSSRDGNKDIYVVDGDGRNQRRVTVNPTEDYDPSWSPNGKKIAFVSNRNRGYIQIWVIDADGVNPVRLTDGVMDGNPDWSPDGKTIAYDSVDVPEDHNLAPGGIIVMDADGNNKRLLTEKGAHSSWSPDGERIAFISGRIGKISQIFVMDADGRNPEQLTDDLVDKRMPSWSPDGRRIAYVVDRHIYVMDSNGKNQRRLTKTINVDRPNVDDHPTWSPQSDTIAFHSWRRKGNITTIYTVEVKSGAVNPFGQFHEQGGMEPDWLYPGELSVSPEGSHITIWGRLKDIASSLR